MADGWDSWTPKHHDESPEVRLTRLETAFDLHLRRIDEALYGKSDRQPGLIQKVDDIGTHIAFAKRTYGLWLALAGLFGWAFPYLISLFHTTPPK